MSKGQNIVNRNRRKVAKTSNNNLLTWFMFYTFAFIIFAGLLFSAYQSIEQKYIAYTINRLAMEKKRLVSEERSIKQQIAKLESLERLQKLASTKTSFLQPLIFPKVCLGTDFGKGIENFSESERREAVSEGGMLAWLGNWMERQSAARAEINP